MPHLWRLNYHNTAERNGFFLAFGEHSCVPTVAVRDRDRMKRRGYEIFESELQRLLEKL